RRLIFRARFLLIFVDVTATTELDTLSLHDALPICSRCSRATCRTSGRRSAGRANRPSGRRLTVAPPRPAPVPAAAPPAPPRPSADRKSTRLNSSHGSISYAVFCLKKKKRLVAALPT